MAYMGLTALSGAQPIWVVTSSNGVTPAAPTAAPTYATYEEGTGTAVSGGGGTMTQIGAVTGLYRASITVSTGNGFASGKTYLTKIDWAISGTNYHDTHTFTVT